MPDPQGPHESISLGGKIIAFSNKIILNGPFSIGVPILTQKPPPVFPCQAKFLTGEQGAFSFVSTGEPEQELLIHFFLTWVSYHDTPIPSMQICPSNKRAPGRCCFGVRPGKQQTDNREMSKRFTGSDASRGKAASDYRVDERFWFSKRYIP